MTGAGIAHLRVRARLVELLPAVLLAVIALVYVVAAGGV